jgi:hypothetical protein
LASIPYFNLTNKLSAGSGITITEGSATSSPVITASGFTSVGLSTLFNATQFTNNTGTNKIDMASGYKPASAGTADTLSTVRNIAGVSFNGGSPIDIPYFNLTFKPSAGTGIGITTGTASTSPVISASYSSINLIGIFNATQFTNNTGTNKIDMASGYKPASAGTADTLSTARNIAGVSFNGSAPISIPYDNLTFKPTAGSGITITAGSSTLSPIISASASTPTSSSLISIFDTTQFADVSSKIVISSTWKPLVSSYADTLSNGRTIAGATFNGSADISIEYSNLNNVPWVRAPFAVNNACVSTTRYVKIGDGVEPSYPLHVIGDVNITGEFRKNGTIFGTTFDASAITSGTLPVARGGTGQTSYTAGSILFGALSSTSYLSYSTTGCFQVFLSTGFSTGTQTYTYFALGTQLINVYMTSLGNVVGYFNGNLWCTGRILATSDSRIKENIQDINDDSALQMILAIEPKTYNYIDKIERG